MPFVVNHHGVVFLPILVVDALMYFLLSDALTHLYSSRPFPFIIHRSRLKSFSFRSTMDRSSRASAQSPPAVSFQHNPFASSSYSPPPDWPPRMSRARAHEQHWLPSPPPYPTSPPRAPTAQGVASRPRHATDASSSSSPVASRPRFRLRTSRDSHERTLPTETTDPAILQGLSGSPSPPPARRSTRKRKAPETLTLSPESAPKKRAAPEKPPAAASAAKKPPVETRPPGKLKADPDEDEKQQDCDSNCCICMTEPEPQEVAFINGCEHSFCFGCIEKWSDRENTCPLCKTRFTKIERSQKTKRGKSTVKVKEKSQRSEFTSSIALEGLFGELGRSGIAFESFFGETIVENVLLVNP